MVELCEKRHTNAQAAAEGGSVWAAGDGVLVNGRAAVVIRDMRPKHNRATVKWSDTGKLEKKIDADTIRPTCEQSGVEKENVSTVDCEALGSHLIQEEARVLQGLKRSILQLMLRCGSNEQDGAESSQEAQESTDEDQGSMEQHGEDSEVNISGFVSGFVSSFVSSFLSSFMRNRCVAN